MRATKDAPVPDRLPRARGRVLGRPTRATWVVLAVALVAGVGACLAISDRPARTAGSYGVALVVVVVCFGAATLNVRMANRISPGLAFGAAIFSYVATVGVLLIALAASSSRVVDGYGVLAGCVVAVVVWMGGLIRASWVR